jgi:transketolase
VRFVLHNAIINRAADNARILSAAMVQKAKSGHPGGAMGATEFFSVLFKEFLKFNPKDPNWRARDRFFMDPGHMSAVFYSALCFIKKLTIEDLKDFRQLGSHTPGHPDLDVQLGVENTSGPLGLGHAIALGSAIAERILVNRFGKLFEHKTICLLSDGTVQEEVAYGVGRMAGHLKLSNLIFYFDSNGIQLSSPTDEVMSHSVAAQYESWGWRVYSVDGHSAVELRKAFADAYSETEKPVIIIGTTTMGKGIKDAQNNAFENQVSTHGQPIDAAGASTAQTIASLGGNHEDPFVIWPDVEEAFNLRLEELQKESDSWQNRFETWKQTYPALAQELENWQNNKAPVLDLSVVPQKQGVATRVNSGAILAWLAENQKNMVCSSADLSNSDNTQAFLNKTGILKPGDFSGAFLQAGVAELTMGAAACGIVLHGEFTAACATFFVFSDYMKPILRLASLMALPVKFLFTHDSFRVGEDGPTHEPVEQEAQLRLLENLTLPNGKPAMLVLRPADANETTLAWEIAMANGDSPTSLILSRQIMPPLENPYSKANAAGYIVQNAESPNLTFAANGSDVFLCCQAAEILRKEGISVRVVSVMSPRLFMDLPQKEREAIIPRWSPAFAVSSGLPSVFEPVVGPLGRSWGLVEFGKSAPAAVLEKEFGYTPEAVAEKAKTYLADYKEMRRELCS